MSREIDGGTGLYYVRNRWYDVQLGRFLSEDPIGLGGGINWYAYAGNSPTNLRDPFGLEPCVITFSYKYNKKTGEIIPGSVRIIDISGDCEGEEGGGGGGSTGNSNDKEKKTCANAPGVLRDNIKAAERQRWNPLALRWFHSRVKTGGPWDYKAGGKHPEYENFGNFNYGATGAAAGISAQTLLRAAGRNHRQNNPHTAGKLGHWTGGPPYGDDPRDQAMIRLGIQYHQNNCSF